MTEHEILLKKLETTRAELQRAEEEAREEFEKTLAPFKHEYQQAQQAIDDYMSREATEIARTEFGLVVGDVVRLERMLHQRETDWRIVAFKETGGDFLSCRAIRVLKGGADKYSQTINLHIRKGKFKKIQPKKIKPTIDTAREL